MLYTLATFVLSTQILDFFTIVFVRESGSEFHISLDERMDKTLSDDANFESKWFMESVNITDFPIRDHKVILKIRRRRWKVLRTGKSFILPIALDMVA